MLPFIVAPERMGQRRFGRLALSVDLAAVADFDNEDFQSAVLDVGYDPVIADAVFP